jgi:hypothetical protein
MTKEIPEKIGAGQSDTIWLTFEGQEGDSLTIEFSPEDTINVVRDALRSLFQKDLSISFRTSPLTDGAKRLCDLGIVNLSKISVGAGCQTKHTPPVNEVTSVIPFMQKEVDYFTPTPLKPDLKTGVMRALPVAPLGEISKKPGYINPPSGNVAGAQPHTSPAKPSPVVVPKSTKSKRGRRK